MTDRLDKGLLLLRLPVETLIPLIELLYCAMVGCDELDGIRHSFDPPDKFPFDCSSSLP